MTQDYATNAEIAVLAAKIETLTQSVDDLKPILLESSGHREILESIRRDLASSHAKHTDHYRRVSDLRDALQEQRDKSRDAVDEVEAGLVERLDRMERRQVKLGGAFVGAIAVLQLLEPTAASALKAVAGLFGAP